jgi:putative ABC transport system permease protein
MLIARMAFRNVFRQRRRSLLTGLTMTLGFVLFSVCLGLYDGTYGYFIDIFTKDHTGHIQIHRSGYLDRPSLYRTIPGEEELERKLSSLREVVAMAPRLHSPVLALAGAKTTGAQMIGVDPDKETQTSRLAKKVTQGRFFSSAPGNEIIIGSGLSEVLQLHLGDEVSLITQAADGSIANDNFRVIGITDRASNTLERMKCYLPIRTAQQFLVLEGRIHEIAILLRNQKDARRIATQMAEVLGDPSLDVAPWQIVEKQFYDAMQADYQGSYIVLVIITLIVAIGVLNTVLMAILERTREFGVLRALGTRPGTVFLLILYEVASLSVLSIVLAIPLSLGSNAYLSIHGIKTPALEWAGMVFDIAIAEVNIKTIWLPTVVTFCSAMFVSIFPALRAARVTPVAAMRTN